MDFFVEADHPHGGVKPSRGYDRVSSADRIAVSRKEDLQIEKKILIIII